LFAVVRPFRSFFRTEAAGGIVLIVSTVFALVWANTLFARSYEGLLHLPITLSFGDRGLTWPLHHWINDALMSVFFLVVGMEIKRELLVGELRTLRRASLPAIAALGGMLAPAAIHFAFNQHGEARSGWGIPMATDIAFALGCLALVSKRVPSSLVIFLMALAIFDDLGAIVVIAIFYGGQLDIPALAVAGGITVALVTMTRSGVTRVWPYMFLGVALWLAVLRSGIHATIAGVVLGLCIPARAKRRPSEVLDDLDVAVARLRRAEDKDIDASGAIGALERHLEAVQPPLDRMVHGLHAVVAFAIVPAFAIANAGVTIHKDVFALAASPASVGVFLGLALGKPIGVFGATWLAVTLRIAPRPSGSTWTQVFGISVLAGIGFTMSIFVATLAFPQRLDLQDASKIGIFGASLWCAFAGLILLRAVGAPRAPEEKARDIEIILDLPRFAEGYRVETWVAIGALVGKTLGEAGLRSRFGVTVLGVYRGGRGSLISRGLEAVGADYRFAPGDTIIVVGSTGAVDAFLSRAEDPDAPASAITTTGL
jgi:NhaA family Na+:H+ antiporter